MSTHSDCPDTTYSDRADNACKVIAEYLDTAAAFINLQVQDDTKCLPH